MFIFVCVYIHVTLKPLHRAEDLRKLVSRHFSLFNTYNVNVTVSTHTNTCVPMCVFKGKNHIPVPDKYLYQKLEK